MKDNIIKLLQHEISICNKLDAEYRDEYFEKVGAGDEVGARVLDDMRIQLHGEKYGLETAIKYIESILKD